MTDRVLRDRTEEQELFEQAVIELARKQGHVSLHQLFIMMEAVTSVLLERGRSDG